MRSRRAIIALFANLLLLGSLLWGMTALAAPGELFVSPNGSGDACTQAQPCPLQTALAQARANDTIIVAEGHYTGSHDAVIDLTKSVTLLGGWDGSPTGPVYRLPSQHPSVLDGEHQRRVIYVHGRGVRARVEGFVIQFGNAANAEVNPGYGGGFYSLFATPTLVDNIIAYNVGDGGPASLGAGGGACITAPEGRTVIAGNTIISNTASIDNRGVGGGMYVLNAPHAQIADNEFRNNVGAQTANRGYGGGLAISNSAGALVISNIFHQNRSLIQGNGNSQGYGGGLFISGDAVSASGNTMLNNTAIITGGVGYGGGIAINGAPNVIISNNRVTHNIAQSDAIRKHGTHGGGIYCFRSNNIIIGGNNITDNIASTSAYGAGGGVYLQSCNQGKIIANWITSNWGSQGPGNGYGGGLDAYATSELEIEGNRFLENQASESQYGYGGGLYLSHNTTFTMTNNIVARNTANYHGGGISCETVPAEPITGTLLHNTFVANNGGSSSRGRTAIDLRQGHVELTLVNNIIAIHEQGIYVAENSRATLHHTLFYANHAGIMAGEGDIENHDALTGQDPLLTADYHLRAGSPAIDAGMVAGVGTDIDGQPRPLGFAPDIGADEHYYYLLHLFLPHLLHN